MSADGSGYYSGVNFGIGESTPLATLHIKEGDSGLSSLNGSGTNLFLEANGANAAGMTIASGNTANGYIIFGDSDSNFRGAIQYDHSTPDKMHFVTAGSQRLSIDQNGNVGIGVTTPTAGGASGTPKLHVNGAARIDGNVAIAPDSGTPYISGGSTGTQWRNNANGATLLTILDGGNIGIGITAPATVLQVVSNETHTDNHFTTADKGIVVGSSTTLGEGLALWHRGDGSDVIGSLYDNAGVGLVFVNRASSSANAKVALTLKDGNATFGAYVRADVIDNNGACETVTELTGSTITDATFDAISLDGNAMYEITYASQHYDAGNGGAGGWRYVRWHAFDGSGGGGDVGGDNWYITVVENTGTGESGHTPSWSVVSANARITYGSGYMSYRRLIVRALAGTTKAL